MTAIIQDPHGKPLGATARDNGPEMSGFVARRDQDQRASLIDVGGEIHTAQRE